MAFHEDVKARGVLIVVEGLDRAGKTVQCQLLLEALQQRGHHVKYIKFPGNTTMKVCLGWVLKHACSDRNSLTGKIINGYLQGQAQQDDHSIHLLFSANRWEAAQRIRSDLSNGITIIVDRYSYSGAVYSAAKENPDLSLEWAWQPEVGLPRPDLLLFLSISAEETAKRGGYGEERYETNAMQSKVRHLFDRLLSMNHGHDIHLIDARFPVDQVAKDILNSTLGHLSERKPLETFAKLRSWQELTEATSQESVNSKTGSAQRITY
ncbi:hypothetical protein EPUS_07033 [Endocarpon pusillum Z07020]|uniref:dTMP kinase n=1 Tax=Endocarpon pusillum (strain Z07020 / HMAS-L-300199) TaxID=1263415 RepID=U1FXZ8_ENDPU|nr:uncharacterized protein EPUS_07033 [Endocarpon pusillum Z07020]ERF69777.1 hypothetical protein EPUS_07033 [Endocarpon pusillum Z07020]